MAKREYEIDVPDELWKSACEASGLTDPSAVVEKALRELLEREELRRSRRGDPAP